MQGTPDQIEAAVSNHFAHLYRAHVQSMLNSNTAVSMRSFLSMAHRLAKAVSYEYLQKFEDDWIPVVKIDPSTRVEKNIVVLDVSFVLRKGMSLN